MPFQCLTLNVMLAGPGDVGHPDDPASTLGILQSERDIRLEQDARSRFQRNPTSETLVNRFGVIHFAECRRPLLMVAK